MMTPSLTAALARTSLGTYLRRTPSFSLCLLALTAFACNGSIDTNETPSRLRPGGGTSSATNAGTETDSNDRASGVGATDPGSEQGDNMLGLEDQTSSRGASRGGAARARTPARVRDAGVVDAGPELLDAGNDDAGVVVEDAGVVDAGADAAAP